MNANAHATIGFNGNYYYLILTLLNHFSLILFFFLSSFILKGQTNLILNGDFEEYYTCPDDMTQIERCKFVSNPIQFGNFLPFSSTSDFYNGCYISGSTMTPVGVPNNVYGYQQARSGESFVGFGSADDTDESYREYVQLSFSQNLICGNIYEFSIYFNIPNFYKYSRKEIAFYFSEKELNNENNYLYNLYEPLYIDQDIEVIDTLGWTKLSFQFIADRPYRFVSVGHTPNVNTNLYFEVNSAGISSGIATYFFVDDASLFEKGTTEVKIPNVFSPNNDGINDVFEISGNIDQFKELIIFNRWGNEIKKIDCNLSWDGKEDGVALNEGVYYYHLLPFEGCENSIKRGMIHLIR